MRAKKLSLSKKKRLSAEQLIWQMPNAWSVSKTEMGQLYLRDEKDQEVILGQDKDGEDEWLFDNLRGLLRAVTESDLCDKWLKIATIRSQISEIENKLQTLRVELFNLEGGTSDDICSICEMIKCECEGEDY